ncbi:nitronate monooxygenase [Tardiphaga alba]|uniref:Nitronate monooxygenase n=1 Tax=Tardiphaga alba TaxID=340268 RepID=A0ABX8A562_9BRAD|nr:nitronate monooxygenase [Tardiphaga alba]QUS38829.1 nitronate monooxygenase [Tardiphaga alba]
MTFPSSLRRRMTLPLIAAPMFRVSGPDLVIAAGKSGVIGSFPTANCRTIEELDSWLVKITSALGPDDAPYCPNLIMRRDALMGELKCLLKFRPEIVITSVGSPKPVIEPLHDIGCLVFADVASIKHAQKALEAGADGLILLTAGAGGQTGWANGFAFARAVRAFFDGPLVMAGGISDGQALWATEALGCDLAYMGTKFIATQESMALEGHKAMLVNSSLDDVMLSNAFTGLLSNTLRPSVIAAGLDPENLPTNLTEERAAQLYGSGAEGPKRWRDIWSAGHSVSGVTSVPTVRELTETIRDEYDRARNR